MSFLQTSSTVTPNEAILIQQNNVLFQENFTRSQNEQILYTGWRKAEEEKNTLLQTISKLQSQMANMQKKHEEMEKRLPQKKDEENVEYHTDEEELARETEWIRVKNRERKRKRMDTSITPPKNKNENERNISDSQQIVSKKTKLPPPIVVDGIKNFHELHEQLNSIIEGFQIKIINNEVIKINVRDSDSYRLVIKILEEKNLQFHSYENKQDRPIKVIVNKLHHSFKPESIVKELKTRGFKILEATPKLKFKDKKPLDMFMLSFEKDEDINKIYSITDIMHIKVEILPLRKSKLIAQCKRCQAYGHTQRYCVRQPRCVRCPGKHITRECDKPKNVKPKCVHCGDEHPANYRGCFVAKEMQKIRDRQTKKTILPVQPQRAYRQSTNSRREINQKKENDFGTYSQALAGNNGNSKSQQQHHQQQQQQQAQSKFNTDEILQQILDKLTVMENRITDLEHRVRGAIPKQRNG